MYFLVLYIESIITIMGNVLNNFIESGLAQNISCSIVFVKDMAKATTIDHS